MTRAFRKSDLSAQVVVRLTPELRDAVEAAASADRRNPSQLIRNIIEDAIKTRMPSPAATA